MEDRSLDDFLDAGSDGTESDDVDDSDVSDDVAGTGESDPEVDESDDDGAGASAGTELDGPAADTADDSADSTDDSAEDSTGVDADAVEPATSTYVWDSAGGGCGACGATVDRRWRQDDDLVCVECKEW